jgi:hypothetical protein
MATPLALVAGLSGALTLLLWAAGTWKLQRAARAGDEDEEEET